MVDKWSMTTKKEARAAKAAWNLAISEGRVVRYSWDDASGREQMRFVAYPSAGVAQQWVQHPPEGQRAAVVNPALAQR